MRTPRRLLASLATLILVGCVAYQPKELAPAATQSAFESRSLADAGLRHFFETNGLPPADEWDLARLTLAGFYFSPQLDLARAEFAAAEAAVRAARAVPNPTLTFTPGYNRDAVGVTPWIFGYALNLPIELAGRRPARISEARENGEAARFELAAAAWQVRKAIRQALVDLHAAEATAALWRSQGPLLTQAARLVQAQVEAGDVSPLFSAQARVAANRADLSAREGERAITSARSRLAETMGVPLAALHGVRLSYRGLADSSEPVASSEARRWAAQNRAELLAALSAYSAAQFALKGEIARQYPDLSLGPGYELDQGEGKWSLALGITLPVFHQNQGPIASAQARREVAAARFISAQNRVLAEVDRALADLASARDDLATIEAMRSSLERQTRTVQAQHEAGETSRLDLVRAQIELADHAHAELAARLRAEKALGAIEDAMQRPLAWPETAWRNAARTSSN